MKNRLYSKPDIHFLTDNKLFSLLSVLLVCFSSCISYDESELKNLNDNKVQKIGHAGLGFSSWIPFNPYPANSYSSLQKALEDNNADGLEVDIHMTEDEEFVLYHDNKLESRTNKTGCISELKFNEIVEAQYQLGAPFDWFQSEKVIGLDSLIGLLKKQREFPYLHIDIRHYSVCLNKKQNNQRGLKMIKRLIERLESYELPESKVVLISLSPEVIQEAQRLNCPYALSLEETSTFEHGLKLVKELNLQYLTIKPSLLTAENSVTAHQKGVKIITFGAKSKSGNKRLLKLNPDVIQTNNLKALGELLED